MIYENLKVLILEPEDVLVQFDGVITPKKTCREMYAADIVLYITGRDMADNRVLKCRMSALGTDLTEQASRDDSCFGRSSCTGCDIPTLCPNQLDQIADKSETKPKLADVEEEDDRSMFRPKVGTWIVESQSDPRWNASGRGALVATAGLPLDASTWIYNCTDKYGTPPDDLTCSCMKD